MKNVNSDIAYDYIRKRILSGEFPPGSALMTNALSSEIGVSRTPVRDALRQLETDGLVCVRPRLGASVKEMDMKEFREMSDLRLALESHASGLAAQHRTDLDLQEIGFALEEMRRLTKLNIGREMEQPAFNELVREDVRFHIAIMTSAKNDLMKKEILRLHLINRVVSGPPPALSELTQQERDSRRLAVLASHEEIFDAIAKRDSASAKDAMARHLQEMIDHHLSLLRRARSTSSLRAQEMTEDELLYTA